VSVFHIFPFAYIVNFCVCAGVMCCLLWCYEGMRVFVKYVLRV